MVRSLVMAAVLAAHAPAAAAQSVDWRAAGGDLFGHPVQAETSTVQAGAAVDDLARLPALSQPFQDAVDAAALVHGLDPKLLHALVVTESAYQPEVCSPAGACGLTQLMPGTARDLRVSDRLDPAENLRGGADYLARQIVRFGDLRLALAAYNAGPGRVARLGRAPDIAETRAYVVAVIECYLALTAARGVRNARQCRPQEPTP